MTRLSERQANPSESSRLGAGAGRLTHWRLQDAKARFSELVKKAVEEGPQHVSVRGAPCVVVISEAAFSKLTRRRRSIVDHLLADPPWPDDVVDAINDRPRDTGRDVDL